MSQLYSTAAASLLSFQIVSVIPDVLVLNTVLNNMVSGNTLFNITMFNKHCLTQQYSINIAQYTTILSSESEGGYFITRSGHIMGHFSRG
jgi:hypothetical protein